MIHGEKEPITEKFCKICGKALRPLLKNKDWDNRQYHITCYNQIINDLNNFNKVAYTKYNYKRKVNGMTLDEAKEHLANNKQFILTFD